MGIHGMEVEEDGRRGGEMEEEEVVVVKPNVIIN